jgi:hypothetical protein
MAVLLKKNILMKAKIRINRKLMTNFGKAQPGGLVLANKSLRKLCFARVYVTHYVYSFLLSQSSRIASEVVSQMSRLPKCGKKKID